MGRLDNLITLNTARTCAYTKTPGLSPGPDNRARYRIGRGPGRAFLWADTASTRVDTRVTSRIADEWDSAVSGKRRERYHAR